MKNFKSSYNSTWSTYIQINDVVNWQTRGRLDFSISNMIVEPCELQAVDVSFENADKYRWRGTSTDEMIDLTIIKNSEGYSGVLLNHYTLQKFYILPVDTTKSVLIETIDTDIRCGNETEHKHPSNEECENPCPGHIDILFLVTPEAEAWMVGKEYYATYLDLMIAELYLVFGNDNILHTVDYNWVSYAWSDETNNCQEAAENLSNNQNVQQLRQDNHADIVVCLVPPSTQWYSSLACVPSVNTEYENAFIMLPIDNALQGFIFVHEIGHTLGAEHSNVGNFQNFNHCTAHHVLNFPATLTPTGAELYPAYQRGTVLRGDRPIPHYSDPYDTFYGIATGVISPNGVVPQETNNAGRVRSTGCTVGDFEPSPTINANVTIDDSNACMVTFQAFTDFGGTDDFEYEWFWSYEGFFSSQYPGTPLGIGSSLTIDIQNQPVNNPCINYFIQVVVSLNGEVVDSYTVLQQGGLCTNNPVGCGGAASSLSAINNNEFPSTYNPIALEVKQQDSHQYYIFDIYGRLLWSDKERPQISELQSMNFVSGLYLLVAIDGGNIINTQKIILQNIK